MAPIRVEDKPPTANTLEPGDKTRTIVGARVFLIGQGQDLEYGNLPDQSLKWRSSRDGELGIGRRVETDELSQDVHLITLIATDSARNTGASTITVYVDRDWLKNESAEDEGKAWLRILLGTVLTIAILAWRFLR